jgi:hypothetical protein
MTLRWSVYSGTVDDARDEEILNDCFADLVDDSLERGPAFLNYLLDGLVEFESGARIEGTDRETLPDGDGAEVRIDLTVGDESKIVGFESKRRDSLSRSQLENELEKLEYNAAGRDVVLVAITEHLEEPETVVALSEHVRWTSWFRIAQRAFTADSLGDSWGPTASRTQKMFREFGYNEFDGIDSEEFTVTVWELWKQTATQIDGLDTGIRWPNNLLREPQGTSKGWRPIDPDWMLLTFNEDARRPSETCYVLVSNKQTQDIWAGLAIHPNGQEKVQDFLCDNAVAIADRVLEDELDVIQFPLNWLVGRKNLPKGHGSARTAKFPSERDELVNAFSDRKAMKDNGAKRFVFGYSVNPSSALDDTVTKLERLEDIFETADRPKLSALLENK